MDSSAPGIFSSFCCCFVFLAIVAGLVFAIPTSRRTLLRLFGRESVGGPLPPRLAQLAAAAMPGLHKAVVGLPTAELQRVSELVASIQLAQELLYPPMLDRAVGDGLQQNPDGVLAALRHGLAQLQPRTRDINRAVATIDVLRRSQAQRLILPTAIYFQNLSARRQRPPAP